MPTPIEALAIHAVETLPDSLSKRRELLDAALHALPPGPLSEDIRKMLYFLAEHDLLQRELPNLFGKPTNPTPLPAIAAPAKAGSIP